MKKIRGLLKKIKEIYVNIGINKIRFKNRQKKDIEEYKNRLGDENITILSPNCIAGEIYNLLGLKFNSPLINCSIDRVDFVEFCCNLKEYLSLEPYISGYHYGHPILTLKKDGLKTLNIRFVHDNDSQKVLADWNRRKERVDFNKLYIICDNKGKKGEPPLNDNILEPLNKIKVKKIIIFVSNNSTLKNSYKITEKQIKKYNYKKMNGLYGFQDFFDYISFFTTSERNNI